MGQLVVAGAMVKCSFGVAPTPLVVLPEGPLVAAAGRPVATIADCLPIENIVPFGVCTSMVNPEVAAATTAAMGVLTPMPCVPVTTPWVPGAPTVLVDGVPALTFESACVCAWAGVISVVEPGQTNVVATP